MVDTDVSVCPRNVGNYLLTGHFAQKTSIFRTGIVRRDAEKGVLMRADTKAPVLRLFFFFGSNARFQFTPFIYVL